MELDSIHYTIGQVSELTDIPQSALRYWETVFDALDPLKSPGGNRKYSEEDIRIILKIKELLYVKGYTIKGANIQVKKDLEKGEITIESEPVSEVEAVEATLSAGEKQLEKSNIDQDTLKYIIRELKSILRILED